MRSVRQMHTSRQSRYRWGMTEADLEQRRAELAELAAAVGKVANGWYRLYERGDLHADWEDFQHYKANARWATGAHRDLEKLDVSRMTSREALFDAAGQIFKTRRWDTDYEEPVDSRRQLLAIVEELRRRSP